MHRMRMTPAAERVVDKTTDLKRPSTSTLRGLDWLNFFLADVQSGVGPFLAIYLATNGWNEQVVGGALTVAGIAGIVTNTPAGALVDRVKSKRAMIAAGVLVLAVGALGIALFPSYRVVMISQALIGAASAVFGPAITAVSLGIVGRELFDRRQGRNQAFNSAGNVVAAVLIGLIGYLISNRGVFFFVVALSVPTLLSLLLIRPDEIDYKLARNLKDGVDRGRPVKVWRLLSDRPLFIFLICAVLFHFANAAMLPLLGELLAKGKGRSSMALMSGCVITTQFVITLFASRTGKVAGTWGRKPLLLIGFAVLPIRAVLYTLTHNSALLVAIQVLDGIGACVFGVVSVLVIADLTRGTGRFNLAQGAIATAVGIGASFSQAFAGAIVHHAGYRTGFLSLAGIAAVALALLWLFMPETLERDVDSSSRPQSSAS
jgi:predicted MFS family arabinose efflux permease